MLFPSLAKDLGGLRLVPNVPLGMPSVTLRVTKFDETMTNAPFSFKNRSGLAILIIKVLFIRASCKTLHVVSGMTLGFPETVAASGFREIVPHS